MAAVDTEVLGFEGRLSTLEERSTSQATKEDLAILRAEMVTMKADLIKWFIGTQIALAALIIYLLQ